MLNMEDQDTALLLLKARFKQVQIETVFAKEEDQTKIEEEDHNENEKFCEADIDKNLTQLDASRAPFERQSFQVEEEIKFKSANLSLLDDTITLYEQEKFEIEEKIKFFDDMAKIELDQSYSNTPRNRQTLSSQDSSKVQIGFQCHKCGFQTSLHTNLKVHLTDKHPAMTRRNQSLGQRSLKRSMCDLCKVASDRTYHMDEYMETRSLDESCQFCSFEYPQIPKTKYIRTSFVANFECEKCEFSTTQKTTLQKHTKNEHGWLDGWLFN